MKELSLQTLTIVSLVQAGLSDPLNYLSGIWNFYEVIVYD